MREARKFTVYILFLAVIFRPRMGFSEEEVSKMSVVIIFTG